MIKTVSVAFGTVSIAYGSLVVLNTEVEHLRDCEPRRWWKEVKSLGGMQLATRADPTSVLKHIDSGPVSSCVALANVTNNALLAPMDIFTPLDPGISVVVQHTDTPIVTEFCVLKKLIALNPAKSSGPDGVPAWLLKTNAELLAPVVTDTLNCSSLFRLVCPSPGSMPKLPPFLSRPLFMTLSST